MARLSQWHRLFVTRPMVLWKAPFWGGVGPSQWVTTASPLAPWRPPNTPQITLICDHGLVSAEQLSGLHCRWALGILRVLSTCRRK